MDGEVELRRSTGSPNARFSVSRSAADRAPVHQIVAAKNLDSAGVIARAGVELQPQLTVLVLQAPRVDQVPANGTRRQLHRLQRCDLDNLTSGIALDAHRVRPQHHGAHVALLGQGHERQCDGCARRLLRQVARQHGPRHRFAVGIEDAQVARLRDDLAR